MPKKPNAADKLCQRLMQMQEEAVGSGRFEVAYHLLAAAGHGISTASAQRRGNTALFATSSVTASAARARIAADAAVSRLRDHPGGAD